MRRRAPIATLLTLFAVTAFACTALADDVRLETRSGASSRMPLRVTSLTPAGDRDAGTTSVLADEVLAADLQHSAAFDVARAWLAAPQTATPVAEVGGKWTLRGSTIRLSGEVREYPGKQVILAKEYSGPASKWRDVVHRFADDVVLQFTGEPGVAATRIAFIVQDGRNKELWVMDSDGWDPRPLTADHSVAQSPSWSPDGSLLLFTSYRGGGGPQIWVLSPETRKPFLLSGRQGLNTGGMYAPDGSGIVCTLGMDGNAEIYRLDARGGAPQRLTSHRGIDTSPCWAPTGREIAFTSDRSGVPQVHVMDADGGNVRRLTYDVSYTDSPAWSPRGDRIAFVVRTDAGFDIWTCRSDGSNTTRIVAGGSNENPRWSPDGRHLVFSSDRDGTRSLWVTDLDGASPRKLDTGGRKAMSPAWSPRTGATSVR